MFFPKNCYIISFLEERTVAKAREGIKKLVHLTLRTARVVRSGAEEIIPAKEVQIEDILQVLVGETIAVVTALLFDASLSSEELLKLTASAELRSEHPLGKAVVSHFRASSATSLEEPQNFEMIASRGVKSILSNDTIFAGNEDLLTENSAVMPTEMKIKASLSQKTMSTIKWNLSLSMALNFAAIILAMTGILLKS